MTLGYDTLREGRTLGPAARPGPPASAPAMEPQENGSPSAPAAGRPGPTPRAAWLRTLYRWHWISSALCLVGMIFFAVTGITLNHAASIGARPVVSLTQGQVPAALLRELQRDEGAAEAASLAPLPDSVRRWLSQELGIATTGGAAEWEDGELYLAMPRPGGDAWLRIALHDGTLDHERTDRGWVAYLNDLHKGRHTGGVWTWLLDLFSAACLLFSATGLAILALHAGKRPLAWPVIGLGGVIPVLLALLFIH